MRHKLTTFILRNPPKRTKTKPKPTGEGADKEGGEGGNEEEDAADDGGSDDEFTKRIKAEAAELPTAEQLELANGVAGLAIDADEGSDEGADSPYSLLTLWIEENKADDAKNLTPSEVLKKVQELGIETKHKTVQTLTQTLFTEKATSEVNKYQPVFQKVSLGS